MFWLVQNWWSLRARRKHLILRSDLCMSSSKDVFLRIVDPKPGRRGLGSFLDSVFGSLDGEALLFNGTPSSFRSRWTKVLVALKTLTTFRITLAGLRAGGAVELYRQGRTIHDIFWALRLRHLVSLLRYLQEVSTSVRTRDLPIDAKTINYHFMLPSFSLYCYVQLSVETGIRERAQATVAGLMTSVVLLSWKFTSFLISCWLEYASGCFLGAYNISTDRIL